jgi:acetoin utilization deacetylase AcuC-like enzyme
MSLKKDHAKLHIFWHSDVQMHDTGSGLFEKTGSPLLTVHEKHPEGPDRISNMLSILKRGPIAPHLKWHWGRYALETELLTFHTSEYLEMLISAERQGGKRLTPSTVLAPGSLDACRAAAGTTLEAMSFVLKKKNRLAYALVRPCGHHAARAQSDGYCILNNVALATELAIKSGSSRIAIIDWDVHHGNGTQEGFYAQNNVLTISLHMDHGAWGPSHPQTGGADEVGCDLGKGFNFNIPLPMGTGDSGYDLAMRKLVVPTVNSYRPDVLIIACGQDASQFDPVGRQLVTMEGFRRMGEHVRTIAEQHTSGSLLLVQEGGYSISYSAFCLHATLEGVLGKSLLHDDPLAFYPDDPILAHKAIAEISKTRIQAMEKN